MYLPERAACRRVPEGQCKKQWLRGRQLCRCQWLRSRPQHCEPWLPQEIPGRIEGEECTAGPDRSNWGEHASQGNSLLPQPTRQVILAFYVSAVIGAPNVQF